MNEVKQLVRSNESTTLDAAMTILLEIGRQLRAASDFRL